VVREQKEIEVGQGQGMKTQHNTWFELEKVKKQPFLLTRNKITRYG